MAKWLLIKPTRAAFATNTPILLAIAALSMLIAGIKATFSATLHHAGETTATKAAFARLSMLEAVPENPH